MSSFHFLCISLVRRRLQQIQLVKGPNRILLTLEDLTFINPQLSKKVSSIPESYRINPLFTIMKRLQNSTLYVYLLHHGVSVMTAQRKSH